MIRVFIGTEPKTYVAQRVLEFSILQRTKMAVEFTPMIGPAWEYPLDGIKVGTGFSLRRWMIPAACQFQGKAIYLDADQLVLGDIDGLWEIDQRIKAPTTNQVWCTYQPDKHSKQPWPQSSVMLINCAAAEAQPQYWTINGILDHLRANPHQVAYANFMHATWMNPQPTRIPDEWNHLNVHTKNTKLLHYTKEPEQPWYKPDHPLAKLWEKELQAALQAGYVTNADLTEALSRWNVKEDWRNTNGLHPYYKRYVAKAPVKAPVKAPAKAAAKPIAFKPLWITTYGKDMYEASGKKLITSFTKYKPLGDLLCFPEGLDLRMPALDTQPVRGGGKVMYWPVEQVGWLSEWLQQNADYIPKHLGGNADGVCRCEGGPYDVHDKRHVMPCLGHWFNRNASRWFRKIVCQQHARIFAEANGYTHLIWIDSDCVFGKHIAKGHIESWFKRASVFYLKNQRPIMEAGVLGFDLRTGGGSLIDEVAAMYNDGSYRNLPRWDDSAVYQHCVEKTKVKCVDIATSVGPNAKVVEYSPLAGFLTHDKGRHGRKLGIMT